MRKLAIYLLVHFVGTVLILFLSSSLVTLISPLMDVDYFTELLEGYPPEKWPLVAAGAVVFPAALVGYLCFLAEVARDLIHIGKVYKGLDRGIRHLLLAFISVPLFYITRIFGFPYLGGYLLSIALFSFLMGYKTAIVPAILLPFFSLVQFLPREMHRIILYLLFFVLTPIGGYLAGKLLPAPKEVPKEYE